MKLVEREWVQYPLKKDEKPSKLALSAGQSIIWIEGVPNPDVAEEMEITEDFIVFQTIEGEGKVIRKEHIEQIDIIVKDDPTRELLAVLQVKRSIVRTKGPTGNITADSVEILEDFVKIKVGSKIRFIRKDLVNEIEEILAP